MRLFFFFYSNDKRIIEHGFTLAMKSTRLTYHLNGPCFGYAVSFLSKRLKGYHPL